METVLVSVGDSLLDVLSRNGFVRGYGEGHRLFRCGGITVNGVKVFEDHPLCAEDFEGDGAIVVGIGRARKVVFTKGV